MMLYAQVMDPKFREPFGNVNRWFLTCINQPQFKSVLGEFKLCEKMAVFDNKKYQELHPKTQKAKDTKPKQEKKPKEEKPKVAAQAVVVEKPKKKDHFGHLPETTSVTSLRRHGTWKNGRGFIPTTKLKHSTNTCGRNSTTPGSVGGRRPTSTTKTTRYPS